jgi:hypothetical protein
MTFTKRETQILVLAIGTAIDKETRAIEGLKTEVRQLGIKAAIDERNRHVGEIKRLRDRFITEN